MRWVNDQTRANTTPWVAAWVRGPEPGGRARRTPGVRMVKRIAMYTRGHILFTAAKFF